MFISSVRLASVVIIAALIAACADTDLPTQLEAACLPALPQPVSIVTSSRPDNIDVFIDVSVSSTNFGRASGSTPYRDILAFLIDDVRPDESRRFFGFANEIAPITEDIIVQAAQGRSKVCAACGHLETRLDDLLSNLASDDDRALSVIVTDLWLDSDSLLDQRSLSLSRPIRDIMASGRAVGVVGVAAPYAEPVYDIPVQTGSQTLASGSVTQRPFFILVIGPPDEVLGFRDMVFRDVLASPTDNNRIAPDGNFALFSPVPLSGAAGLVEMMPTQPQSPFSYAPSFIVDADAIPVLRLDRSAVSRLVLSHLKDEAVMSEGAVSAQGLRIELSDGNPIEALGSSLEAWALTGSLRDACEAQQDQAMWSSVSDFPSQFIRAPQTRAGFIYAGKQDGWLVMPRQSIHYVIWSLSPTEAQVFGDDQWMSDWSFEPKDGQALLAEPPDFFPVLNLKPFRDLLTRSQNEAFSAPATARGAALIIVE